MTVLELPDPCLVVLVGPAGAGKTTLAGRFFAADEVLSSDAIREELTGDPGDQRVSHRAFRVLHERVERRLAAGRLTAVDATSVTTAARGALRRQAARHGIPAVAIVIDLAVERLLARNAARPGRTVPEEVVRSQAAVLRGAVDSGRLAAEPFATLVRLTTPEAVAALSVSRRPAAARRPGP